MGVTTNLPGKLLLSIIDSSCNRSSMLVSSQPSDGHFLWMKNYRNKILKIALIREFNTYVREVNFILQGDPVSH